MENIIFDEVCGEVPFLTYPLFEKTGVVKSAFSTRIGGVSKGCYESMNLSFDRGDDKDAVMENFQRIASAIGNKLSRYGLVTPNTYGKCACCHGRR